MRKFLAVGLAATLISGVGSALAATAEQEQAFIDGYRTAFEAQDAAALRGLLFSDGAVPEALEFYEMMMTVEFGHKITSIEVQDLDAEDQTRVDATMPAPDGTMTRLAPRPYKKLVIVIDSTDENGSGTSTSTTYLAEQDGRLGIPVPVPAN